MVNRQVKEWLDKVQLPVGERVLTARLLESFLASPLGARKDYSKVVFNNMLREYASDLDLVVLESNSTNGKYMVFKNKGEKGDSTPLRKISADRLVHDTCELFFKWIANVPTGEKIRPRFLKNQFVNEVLNGRMYYDDGFGRLLALTPQVFAKWLVRLSFYRSGRAPVEGRDGLGKWYILI